MCISPPEKLKMRALRTATAGALLAVAACGSATEGGGGNDGGGAGPSRDEEVAWLRQHAAPISLDPGDADFRDLEPLRQAIGGARVVLLGEASHGDGATFRGRARLIRFLHEQMGFNVLAMENGLYDCHESEQMMAAGADALTALRRCMLPHFPSWGQGEAMMPLWDYVAATRGTPAPLRVSGFDNQFTGTASEEHLVADLEAYLASIGSAAIHSPDWPEFRTMLQAATVEAWYTAPPNAAAQARFFSLLATLVSDAQSAAARTPTREAKLWQREVESIGPQAHNEITYAAAGVWNDATRDHEMGRTLVWLAQEYYPGERIVVIAHSVHAGHDLAGAGYTTHASMGDAVKQAFGAQAYAIAFTAVGGSYGSWWQSPPARDLAPAPPASLEGLVADAVPGDAFLDLRGAPAGGEWLRGSLAARPVNHQYRSAAWPQSFEGFVVVREMTPNPQSGR